MWQIGKQVGNMLDEIRTAKMGPNWAKLGLKGAILGSIWSQVGAFWANVGPCWGHVGTRLGQVGAKMGQVELLGSILEPSCANLGPCWDQIGAKLGQDGAKLEPIWAKLDQVAAKLGLCWQNWTGSWQSQRKVTPHVAENHQRWTHRAQHGPEELDFGRVFKLHVGTQNQ